MCVVSGILFLLMIYSIFGIELANYRTHSFRVGFDKLRIVLLADAAAEFKLGVLECQSQILR